MLHILPHGEFEFLLYIHAPLDYPRILLFDFVLHVSGTNYSMH